jgi:adenine deaminase
MELKRLIAVARGEAPADLLLANARIINCFTGEIEEGSVAVAGDRIAGVGDYTDAETVLDLKGRYLVPGLVDGHVHLESSFLNVPQYAQAVVPHGTLAVVTDLHEIANVTGLRGVRYVMERARRVPMDVFFTIPSCVPASELESGGARIDSDDVRRALRWHNVVGLGEMMDFLGVLGGRDEPLAKLAYSGKGRREGHGPGLTGKELNGYLAPLIGSDHESTGYDEGLEKLRRGAHLMIREGSVEQNLEALLPLVTDRTYHRCMLVVDDRDPLDLYREGDMDAVVRKAIRLGLDPVRAIQLSTLNPARYFGLDGHGAIAPGYLANLLVVSDLEQFDVDEVFLRGRIVARGGRLLREPADPIAGWIADTVHIKPFSVEGLALPAEGRERFPAIEIIPGQIVTRRLDVTPRTEGGFIMADPERDLLKLVVVERHRATGNVGVGLVRGLGLRKGAIGGTQAHDSHNVIVAGTSDEDILAVVREIEAMHGGLACVVEGKTVASLPLPIAGLLSDEPLEMVVRSMEALHVAARELGCRLQSPFGQLSFLALAVIPELRLTDLGLVDVTAGRLLQ